MLVRSWLKFRSSQHKEQNRNKTKNINASMQRVNTVNLLFLWGLLAAMIVWLCSRSNLNPLSCSQTPSSTFRRGAPRRFQLSSDSNDFCLEKRVPATWFFKSMWEGAGLLETSIETEKLHFLRFKTSPHPLRSLSRTLQRCCGREAQETCRDVYETSPRFVSR